MTNLDAAAINDIATRHPEAFRPRLWKRYSGLLALATCALYTVYCWWFFSISLVMSTANWSLAATYLADWVSYEIRPNIEMKSNYLDITYARFSKLGENPDPVWVVKQTGIVDRAVEVKSAPSTAATSTQSSSGSFVAAADTNAGTANSTRSSSNSFVAAAETNVGQAMPAKPDGPLAAPQPTRGEEVVRAEVDLGPWDLIVTPGHVTVLRGDESHEFDVAVGQSVTSVGPLESWAEQRKPGSTVYLTLGWSGRVEIQNDEVVVWRRFFGWKNFFFDTTSPFWGMPLGEVAGLIVSGERLDPSQSNASLAFDNVWFNQDWQHGDVWTKLLQTVIMAFVGTVLASLVAFPLCFLAARNITPNRFANQAFKRFFDYLRSVDMLIWALFFTRAFGPGPLAGIAAIFFTDTGTLGKLYSEALENVDDKQREGVRSVGASPLSVQRFGVLPQVLPVFASQALYFWESNTRSATIIGAVGAGGIGLKLWEAMRTNQNWENVFYMVILILMVVFLFDMISSRLRAALMGRAQL